MRGPPPDLPAAAAVVLHSRATPARDDQAAERIELDAIDRRGRPVRVTVDVSPLRTSAVNGGRRIDRHEREGAAVPAAIF